MLCVKWQFTNYVARPSEYILSEGSHLKGQAVTMILEQQIQLLYSQWYFQAHVTNADLMK